MFVDFINRSSDADLCTSPRECSSVFFHTYVSHPYAEWNVRIPLQYKTEHLRCCYTSGRNRCCSTTKKCEWSLHQRVLGWSTEERAVCCLSSSSSSSTQASLRASTSRLTRVANNHFTMDIHVRVIAKKLECFHSKLHGVCWRTVDEKSRIHWTAGKEQRSARIWISNH